MVLWHQRGGKEGNVSKEAGEGELTEDEFLDRLRVRTYLPGQFFGEYQL
jgi:hypothetical protein